MATKKRKKKRSDNNQTIKLIAALLSIVLAVAVIYVVADKVSSAKDSTDSSSASQSSGESSSSQTQSSSSSTQSVQDASDVTASVTVSLPSGTSTEKIYESFDDSATTGNTADSWNLLLVNTENTLSESYEPDLNKTQVYGIYDGMYVSKSIYDAYIAMFNAAKKDGVTLSACSAYRPYSSQLRNFTNRVNKYVSSGYSEEKAEKITATIIARPGTSEHQTGLVIDFNPCDDSFEKSAAYKWLQKNAENYGFVQRYKKSKSSITGIVNESWHYRYVGVYNAKCMNELDMCLEEYINYISK